MKSHHHSFDVRLLMVHGDITAEHHAEHRAEHHALSSSRSGELESDRLPPMWNGFDSGLDAMRGLSLLVLYPALGDFFPSAPVFPSHLKPRFDLIYSG